MLKRLMIIFICIICLFDLELFVYAKVTELTLDHPIKEGEKFVFEGGTLYERKGYVPQLVVTGTHFQMGKQYGVLLRSEIKYTVGALDQLLVLIAGDKGVPLWIVRLYVKSKAESIAKRLPVRFLDEMRGVAEGSGIPFLKILQLNMIYDIDRLSGCTSVLWKSLTGEIYHGHTTDIAWGLDWPKTIIVQHHPQGYHSFTSITWAGFLGTQTAYNSEGLCYSENTLMTMKSNSKGFSVNYLARIIMEECGSLEEASYFLNKYGTINGEGLVFSDLDKNTGCIFETTPFFPPKWANIPISGNNLWGINLYQSPEFISRIQNNYQTQNGVNVGRIRILKNYFQSPKECNLDNLIELLRTTIGPDDRDYAKDFYLKGICNVFSLQMLIFDPQGRGVYLATGSYYASKNAVFFYPDDFSKSPFLYREAVRLEPVVEDAARILNSVTGEASYPDWKRLAEKYPTEAFIQAYTGWAALRMGKQDIWVEKIRRAYQLEPDFPEYKVAIASVAYYQQDYQQVIDLLVGIEPERISSLKYCALRLVLIEKAYQAIHQDAPKEYSTELSSLKKKYKPLKSWLDRYFKYIDNQ